MYIISIYIIYIYICMCIVHHFNWLIPQLAVDLPMYSLFPTCQVRVVRFYQSYSSPSPSFPPPPSPPPPPRPPPFPPPPLPPLPCSLPPCQLFAKLFANFRTQWALLDLNCKGLSALSTAGPQAGTVRAQ